MEGGNKTFKIIRSEVEEDKMKWKYAIIGQVMGNMVSYLNMKHFAENRNAKGLLEVQRVDLFVLRFQSDSSMQEILEQSPYLLVTVLCS